MNFGLKNNMIQQVQNSCQFHGLSGDDANKHLDKLLHVTQSIKNVYAAGAYNQGGNSYQPQGNRNLLSYRSDNYLRPPGFNQNQNRNNPNQNYQNQNRNQGNNLGIPHGNNQGRNLFFQGASHGQNPPPTYQAPVYQASVPQSPIPQSQVVTTTEFTNYMKANDAILKNMQTNMTSLTNSNLELKNMFGQFIKMNTTSSSGSKTLPSNTVTNRKEDLNGITARSRNAYKGPTIPTTSSPSKVVECETEVTKDTVPPTNNGSTKDVQPLVVQIETLISNFEPVVAPVVEPVEAPVSALKPNPKPSIPYSSSFADALILMPKFGPTIKSLLTNKEKLFELARTSLNEHCSTVLLKKLPEKLRDPGKFLFSCDFSRMDECLALADLSASINLMPLSIWNKLSIPELSPTCMTLELADRSISRPVRVADDVFVKTGRALVDVYEGELTLHVGNKAITINLDQTSRYSANYDAMSVNRIDLIDVACEEYSQKVFGFFMSGNPTPSTKPIVSTSSPTLTPFEDSDFLLEETDTFLAIDDKPISLEINGSYYDSEGDIPLLEEPDIPPPRPRLPRLFLRGYYSAVLLFPFALRTLSSDSFCQILGLFPTAASGGSNHSCCALFHCNSRKTYLSFPCWVLLLAVLAGVGVVGVMLPGSPEGCLIMNPSNYINIELIKEFLEELQINAYHGWIDEDVINHIAMVLKMIDSIYILGVYSHQLRMEIFPLLLADEAKQWWINEREGKITIWEELIEKFLCKFYPESYDEEEEMLDE
uniref:Reverse transcriptase domain-containing protein n=1 Tax=Tanacetum cinerariifolium TaxID=118510 RepID=A0A6L2M7Y9_TANCI|nr:hypothetical protein [Tanacetum cinerariifolium]